jgi:hypothetical protein
MSRRRFSSPANVQLLIPLSPGGEFIFIEAISPSPQKLPFILEMNFFIILTYDWGKNDKHSVKI